ncbi:uncharacterized protein [Malus domestica]|uniref:uncharacterized protein n=1 Tax=Malus domestica TaxID=3750 RepID=UPI00397637E5
MYVCLGACKEGFKYGCRPLIGLDGCHLKSQHGGQLLVVVGIDPNDETWVIAYAVVEMENKDFGIWFLEILAEDIGIINQHYWTFINDKQKGLILTFLTVLPDFHHRFCVRHLYTNYRERFKSGGTKFQVDAGGGDQFVVDLTERTCSCRGFNLTSLPCSHAIAAINYKRDKPEYYVDVCYSKVMYLEIYGHLIQPMNGMSMWEVTENPPIQPPLYTKQPGRPKKKRNKEAAENEK